jgi:methylornithine synthase
MKNHTQPRLEKLLAAIRLGRRMEDDDIRFLLGLTDRELVGRLFQAAREIRNEHFGSKVFLYGFVYFSTFCGNDCAFCQYRRDNRLLIRYRKTLDQILSSSQVLAEAGVHLIDLTMGEDACFTGEGTNLIETLREVKASTHLPIMISPGVVSSELMAKLAGAGADWYACYQETHTRALFATLRPGQSFDARWKAKLDARRSGMLIEEGILSGVGEGIEDVVQSFNLLRILNPEQVRVMTFVPQVGTPMENLPAPDFRQELLIISVLRLAFPDRLIPASLDVEGHDGLERRLNAGANVVTSLIAPGAGLTGVASTTRDVDNSRRMPSAVGPVLARCALTPANPGEYRAWMQQRRPQAVTLGESR